MSNQSAFVGRDNEVRAAVGGNGGHGGMGGANGAGGDGGSDFDKQMDKANKDMAGGAASAAGLAMGAASLLMKTKGALLGAAKFLGKRIPLLYLGYQAVKGFGLAAKSEEERAELGRQFADDNNLIGEDGNLNAGAYTLAAAKDISGTVNAGVTMINDAGTDKMNSQIARENSDNQVELQNMSKDKIYEPLAMRAMGISPEDSVNMTGEQHALVERKSAAMIGEYMDNNGITEKLRDENGKISQQDMEQARLNTAKDLMKASRSNDPEERAKFEEYQSIVQKEMSEFPRPGTVAQSTEIESAVHSQTQNLNSAVGQGEEVANASTVESEVGGMDEQGGAQTSLSDVVPPVYAPLPKEGSKFPALSPNQETASNYQNRYKEPKEGSQRGGFVSSIKNALMKGTKNQEEPMPEPQVASISHGQEPGLGGDGIGG